MVDAIIESFDIWTEAQGVKSRGRVKSVDNISLEGIASLRELILELAIRGKLVPQDPDDESAFDLMIRTKKEIEEAYQDGILNKQKALPEIEKEEYPFALPKGWQFVRLNEIGEWGSGVTPNRSNHAYYGGSIPWFKSGELISDYIDSAEEFVSDLALKETSLRYNYVGDVLLAMYGATIGKTSILGVRATTNQAVCACTPFLCISSIYLLTLLKAYRKRFIGMGAGGAQPNISKDKIIRTVIALPPLAEQKRIVDKVRELMILCDQLEEQQTNKLKTHQALVEALLDTLTEAKDADEMLVAWQQLSLHFDTVFCTEDSIDQLKQAILKLAIMGRLVKQDPNDEPASVLLKKIKKEKIRLAKEGEIGKEKPLVEIKEKEKFLLLPKEWEWVRLGTLATRIDYGTSEKAAALGEVPILRMGNVQDGKITLDNLKYVSKSIKDLPYLYLKKGDLVFNRTNSYELVGKSGVFENDNDTYTLASYLIRVAVPLQMMSVKYLNYYLNSDVCRKMQIEPQITQQTGQANFSGSKLKQILFPLPPFLEQQKIIRKIGELFSLCETLKERIIKNQQIQVSLSKTIVENAIA